jgi:hypothetical protein
MANSSCRPLLQVRAFHCARPPLHGDIGGTSVLRQHYSAIQGSRLHSQRQGSRLHEQILVRALRHGRSQAAAIHNFPPTIQWLVGDGQQGDHNVPSLSRRLPATSVATMAGMGRVLLQHQLPLFAPHNSIPGGLRSRATIPARLHTR